MKNLFPYFFGLTIMMALFFAIKLPDQSAVFPNTWPAFITCTVLCICSLILWYKKNHSIKKDFHVQMKGSAHPVEFLQKFAEDTEFLQANFDSLPSDEICQRIENSANNHLYPYIDQRQRLTDEMGMEKGADIIIRAAQGERFINRVWTALKDGHRAEAKASLDSSHSAFMEALNIAK